MSPNGQNLTQRERSVLRLIVNGLTNPEIATELNISSDTVKDHVKKTLKKLNARNRAHLAAKAVAHHLFVPDDCLSSSKISPNNNGASTPKTSLYSAEILISCTSTQIEIIDLLVTYPNAERLSNQEMADLLNLSNSGLRKRLRQLYKKFSVSGGEKRSKLITILKSNGAIFLPKEHVNGNGKTRGFPEMKVLKSADELL